ncbi:hypothetical protein MTQ01_02260 [Streptomyces sp. XM4193]|uniref:hypothetical protein n=1 Tax=Streptomyces sp. XM4193 TaxID=2929782 RepID=UPI001FF7E9AF|nr:hypothetical protein [Streptomyces sp. XM4193]MCK1794865.1 hypothetical protein [Streptomyces sp. XM4193]
MEGNSLTERLSRIDSQDSRELDRVCEEVAHSLKAAGTPPPFRLTSADFATDPFLICADRYWRLRFLELPSVRTAAECARWLYEHAEESDASGLPFRVEIEEKWALGYAFITRDSVESPTEISEATGELLGSRDISCFATLYQAGKLRANFRFEELREFLESSLLAQAAGSRRTGPLFTALRAFAAYGSRRVTAEHAADLLDHAWYSPHRTTHTVDVCLGALAAAAPFDGQGPLLRDRAQEAATDHPEHHIFVYRLAHGLRLCGEFDEALQAADLALALLPATGSRGSHQQLQEQYLGLRERILEARTRAAEDARQLARLERLDRKYRAVEARLDSATFGLLGMVTLIITAVTFALGSFQFAGGSDLSVGSRLLLICALGVVMLAFSGLLVFGVHRLLRYRRPPGEEDAVHGPGDDGDDAPGPHRT